jgi:hypothetical protein
MTAGIILRVFVTVEIELGNFRTINWMDKGRDSSFTLTRRIAVSVIESGQ